MQDIIHQRIIRYSIENNGFLFLLNFKMEAKMCFMVLEFGNLALEIFWKYC